MTGTIDPTLLAFGAFTGGFVMCRLTQLLGGKSKPGSKAIPPRQQTSKDGAAANAEDIEIESDEEYEAPEGGVTVESPPRCTPFALSVRLHVFGSDGSGKIR